MHDAAGTLGGAAAPDNPRARARASTTNEKPANEKSANGAHGYSSMSRPGQPSH
jgi:hypothetical protein